MADIKREDVLNYLENANMLEISDLIKDIEDKFGVTAAAPVAIAGGATPEAFDSWASEVEHHFYQIRVKSTVGGAAATFEIYYNFVNDRGSAFL